MKDGSCSLCYLSPFSPLLSLSRCVLVALAAQTSSAPAFCVSFLFLRVGVKNRKIPVSLKFKSVSPRSRLNPRQINVQNVWCVNMYINRFSLEPRGKRELPALRGSDGWAARRVSGPALVRTAPALPNPWKPNPRAPAQLPVTHSGASQSQRERRPPPPHASPPLTGRRGRGGARLLAAANPVGQ